MKPHFASSTAHDYWSSHLGISSDQLFSDPLSIITHSGELTGYDGVFALFREGAKVISLPPERAELLRPPIMKLPADLSVNDLDRALRPFASIVIGPAFIGYADSIPPASQPARPLTSEDAAAVAALRAACRDDEWEHEGSDVGEHPAVGVFVGDQVAALAGYEIWGTTIAHISVITHPGYRGRGFGTAAVAHLSARALAVGLLPQYRTLDANERSIRIAEKLGFLRYATSVAARFEPMLLLRDVIRNDLSTFFEQQRDTEANYMAAFTARDPANLGAFLSRWEEIRTDATVIAKTIVIDGQVAGHVMSYEESGRCEVTYWLGREHWSKGIATRALSKLLAEVNPSRPIRARIAKDNTRSLRVLEKCGFTVTAETEGFANARGKEIEEVLLELR